VKNAGLKFPDQVRGILAVTRGTDWVSVPFTEIAVTQHAAYRDIAVGHAFWDAGEWSQFWGDDAFWVEALVRLLEWLDRVRRVRWRIGEGKGLASWDFVEAHHRPAWMDGRPDRVLCDLPALAQVSPGPLSGKSGDRVLRRGTTGHLGKRERWPRSNSVWGSSPYRTRPWMARQWIEPA
jgi:hypothetical protein